MMTLLEKATVLHYHRHRIGEYAEDSVKALGYRGVDSQVKRFEALAGVGDLNGCSLLDVGCGHGDLKGFLDEHFHDFSYVGIDQMAEFIERARSLYGQRPSCYFCVADFSEAELPRADYVFASGVLGYRCAESGYYFTMIEKLFRAARRAFAFNMLDVESFPQHPLLVGHDADEVMAFCKGLSPDVQLVRGYLEDDFTVLMRRESDA
ncbi:MAG: class I SAM-dependent methyltransferase [Mariprofundaceae bacterium]|nr:class I SAM-dependent methyltransferase [Mariprofundaceae bacterium]